MSRRRHFYIVRLRKDDQIVAVGTSEECTEQLGFKSIKTFFQVLSRHQRGQRHRYEFDIMDNEDEEHQEEQ